MACYLFCVDSELLGYLQVAKCVKILLTSRQPCVMVTLDMTRIEALQMKIDASTVQESILLHPKIKLKRQVSHLVPSNFFGFWRMQD